MNGIVMAFWAIEPFWLCFIMLCIYTHYGFNFILWRAGRHGKFGEGRSCQESLYRYHNESNSGTIKVLRQAFLNLHTSIPVHSPFSSLHKYKLVHKFPSLSTNKPLHQPLPYHYT